VYTNARGTRRIFATSLAVRSVTVTGHMKLEGMGRHNHGPGTLRGTFRARNVPSPDTAFSCTVWPMALQRADIPLGSNFLY
jgi:hypothetical protein